MDADKTRGRPRHAAWEYIAAHPTAHPREVMEATEASRATVYRIMAMMDPPERESVYRAVWDYITTHPTAHPREVMEASGASRATVYRVMKATGELAGRERLYGTMWGVVWDYIATHPTATPREVMEASGASRATVYRVMVDVDAFSNTVEYIATRPTATIYEVMEATDASFTMVHWSLRFHRLRSEATPAS